MPPPCLCCSCLLRGWLRQGGAARRGRQAQEPQEDEDFDGKAHPEDGDAPLLAQHAGQCEGEAENKAHGVLRAAQPPCAHGLDVAKEGEAVAQRGEHLGAAHDAGDGLGVDRVHGEQQRRHGGRPEAGHDHAEKVGGKVADEPVHGDVAEVVAKGVEVAEEEVEAEGEDGEGAETLVALLRVHGGSPEVVAEKVPDRRLRTQVHIGDDLDTAKPARESPARENEKSV